MGKPLKELLEELTKTQEEVYSIVGTIESVDKIARTCVVIPLDEPEDKLYGVRLQAAQNDTKGLVQVPVKGSIGIVTFLNRQTGYLALASEIETFEVVVENYKLALNNEGLLLDSGAATLGGVFLDIISTLKTYKLTTNTGVTIAPTPDTMANLLAIESTIKTLLKT